MDCRAKLATKRGQNGHTMSLSEATSRDEFGERFKRFLQRETRWVRNPNDWLAEQTGWSPRQCKALRAGERYPHGGVIADAYRAFGDRFIDAVLNGATSQQEQIQFAQEIFDDLEKLRIEGMGHDD